MKSESKILFTDIPRLNELKYFLGEINFKERQHTNIISDYNWQKIKTRNILKRYDNILASPVEGRISYIHIIIPDEYFENKDLEMFVRETQLNLIRSHLLDNDIYLDCILYTLTFKLSSEWNRISKYYLKSQKFLNFNRAIEGVQLRLFVTGTLEVVIMCFQDLIKIHVTVSIPLDGVLALSAHALRLKLPIMSLIDLKVDFRALYKEGFVGVRKKVYVLPHLKPGTAVNVHLKVPPSCPFRDYREIRDHWESIYGYNLPESDEGMLFIEVTFGWSNFYYIYPIICVCPYEPIQFRCENEFDVINAFSEDLERKFSNICGHSVQLNVKSERVFRPISKLYLASEMIDTPNLSNLVTDSKVIQDFQRQNNKPENNFSYQNNNGLNNYLEDLFLPSFDRAPPLPTPKPSQEKFKCFPIFKAKNKNSFPAPQPLKKLKMSPVVEETSRQNTIHMITSPITSTSNGANKSKDDVEVLARSHNLKKLTVSVLMNFCKENGILVKNRDKKEMIMRKIYDFFHT